MKKTLNDLKLWSAYQWARYQVWRIEKKAEKKWRQGNRLHGPLPGVYVPGNVSAEDERKWEEYKKFIYSYSTQDDAFEAFKAGLNGTN
jgi:hypothetical protein